SPATGSPVSRALPRNRRARGARADRRRETACCSGAESPVQGRAALARPPRTARGSQLVASAVRRALTAERRRRKAKVCEYIRIAEAMLVVAFPLIRVVSYT